MSAHAAVMADAEDEAGKIQLSDAAPDLDLEVLVVENNGLTIRFDRQLGRVAVASRDMSGDHAPVLRERPAIICRSNHYMEYMEAFLDADVQVQVGVLDMFYQPLDSPMGLSLMEPARILYLLGVLEDFTVLHQLLSIYCTNSYQYQGHKLSAMLIFGSKFAHSCHPNVGYSSMSSAEEGIVDYHVIRPIRAGELVCTSYLSDMYETPTNERRELLLQTKSFLCQCERCNGPDYCRVLPCLSSDCDELIACRYDESTQEPYWQCSRCQASIDAALYLRMEHALGKTLETIERAIQNQKGFRKAVDFSPDTMQELLDECHDVLSPCHYLTIKAARLMLNVCTSWAFVQIQKLVVRGLPVRFNTRVAELLRRSAIAGFRSVSASECVAANCFGCPSQHLPLYDQAVSIFNVCDNILQIPIHFWPSCTVTVVQRYMPILRAKFGRVKVQDIHQKIVAQWETTFCKECVIES